LDAAGVEGVGHVVVLAGLPDDRVGVVLAAVVDSHPDPQGQGGLPLPDRLAAVVTALVGRHSIVGIEPVEGPSALADRVAGEFDASKLSFYAATCYTWLGDRQHARDQAEQVIHQCLEIPGQVRWPIRLAEGADRRSCSSNPSGKARHGQAALCDECVP
jgi:hypothetical protein